MRDKIFASESNLTRRGGGGFALKCSVNGMSVRAVAHGSLGAFWSAMVDWRPRSVKAVLIERFGPPGNSMTTKAWLRPAGRDTLLSCRPKRKCRGSPRAIVYPFRSRIVKPGEFGAPTYADDTLDRLVHKRSPHRIHRLESAPRARKTGQDGLNNLVACLSQTYGRRVLLAEDWLVAAPLDRSVRIGRAAYRNRSALSKTPN